MKKWIGALCSGLAGVLSLVLLAVPAFRFTVAKEEVVKYSGWELLTEEIVGKWDFAAVTWYRIFAWVLVVLAVVLIVMAVLQVLANLNIIKMPAILTTINKYALVGVVLVSILALVANFGIRADAIKDMGGKEVVEAMKAKVSVGASLWLVAIVNLVAGACANVFDRAKK